MSILFLFDKICGPIVDNSVRELSHPLTVFIRMLVYNVLLVIGSGMYLSLQLLSQFPFVQRDFSKWAYSLREKEMEDL